MGSFALAVFLLIITPGPGVLSTAGVGAAFGSRAGLRYVCGLFVGTNLVALAVVSGLAALILATQTIRNILLVLSTAYLLYLAFRIAFAGAKIAFIEAKGRPGIYSGITLQIINPKAYAVNTTLFTGFAFLPGDLLARNPDQVPDYECYLDPNSSVVAGWWQLCPQSWNLNLISSSESIFSWHPPCLWWLDWRYIR